MNVSSRKVSLDLVSLQKCKGEKAAVGLPALDRFGLTVIALMATANLMSTVTFSCIVPFFPTEAQLKGLSTSQVGLIIGAFQLVTFAVSPLLGKYMAFLRPNRTFTAGLCLTGLSTIGLGFSKSLPDGVPFFVGVLVLRAGQAIGNSAYSTSSWAILARLFPARIAMLTGVMEITYGIGFTIGPMLGSALYEVGGFGVPLFAVGIAQLTVALPSVLLYTAATSAESGVDGAEEECVPSVLRLLAIPELLLPIASLLLTCMCWCFYEPSLSNHMASFEGFSPTVLTGLMMTLISTFYLVSAPIWGFILDRYLQKVVTPVMLGGSAGMVICMLLMGPSPLVGLPKNLYITGSAFALLGIMGAVLYVPVFKWCFEAAKEHGFDEKSTAVCGCISGLVQSAASIGAFLSTTLGGLSAQRFGFPWTATFVAGTQMVFICIQIVYRLFQRWNRKRANVVVPKI